MIKDCKHLIGLQHLLGTNTFKVCEIEIMIVRDFFVEIMQNAHFMVKSYYSHNKNLKVYVEQVNKITQNSNDDKTLHHIYKEHMHSK